MQHFTIYVTEETKQIFADLHTSHEITCQAVDRSMIPGYYEFDVPDFLVAKVRKIIEAAGVTLRSISNCTTHDVMNCTRCGKDHYGLSFHKFRNPVDMGSEMLYTHWASCPVTDEPIIWKV